MALVLLAYTCKSVHLLLSLFTQIQIGVLTLMTASPLLVLGFALVRISFLGPQRSNIPSPGAVLKLSIEVLWIRSPLSELQIPHSIPMPYYDNVGAILLAANPVLHSRSKHFELDLHFVRDHVAKGHVCFPYSSY